MSEQRPIFSSRQQGWGYVVLGVVAPLVGLGLMRISHDIWIAIPSLLFVFPIGPFLIVLGIVILVRGRTNSAR